MRDDASVNLLIQALAAIIKPIVKEAVKEAIETDSQWRTQDVATDRTFLTIKQAAEMSGLGASTIRLYVSKRQLRAQQVGRRVLIKRTNLEKFLEANPIGVNTN